MRSTFLGERGSRIYRRTNRFRHPSIEEGYLERPGVVGVDRAAAFLTGTLGKAVGGATRVRTSSRTASHRSWPAPACVPAT